MIKLIDELNEAALQWAIAKAEGRNMAPQCWHLYGFDDAFALRLVQREGMTIDCVGNTFTVTHRIGVSTSATDTEVQAAIFRCYVKRCFGNTIDIPEVLAK